MDAAATRRRRRARRRPVRIFVRLRGGAVRPLPWLWRFGTVRTDRDPLEVRVWHRLTPPFPLAGLTLVARGRHRFRTRFPVVLPVLHLRDRRGDTVTLAADAWTVDLLTSLIRAHRHGEPSPPGRLPWGAKVLAAAAFGWLLAWVWFAAAGRVLDARVLANDGAGHCRVEWVEAGRTYADEADCGGKRPEEQLRILALPPPFRGLAVDIPHTRLWVPGIALVGLAPLGGGALARALRRP